MKKIQLMDMVKLGSYEEVDGLELSTITKNANDTEKLGGLIIRGYETKFNVGKNQNGEVYDKGCLDEFIDDYFVKNGLNMPVSVQHGYDIDSMCGRVLVLEVNSVGFYFVVYVPRNYVRYEQVKNLIQQGILQGFSKCGWATDYEWKYKPDGSFDYMLIKKMEIYEVSLVATPANPVSFEKVQEIRNGLRFDKKIDEEESSFDDMFVGVHV